jgi:hypothetical protein
MLTYDQEKQMKLTQAQVDNLREMVDFATIKPMVAIALSDLYCGPDPDPDAVGFETAVKAIREWCNDFIPSDLWLDRDSDLWFGEPDEDDETIQHDWADLKRILFGRELFHYV